VIYFSPPLMRRGGSVADGVVWIGGLPDESATLFGHLHNQADSCNKACEFLSTIGYPP